MKIKPLYNNIIVKLLLDEQISSSVIIKEEIPWPRGEVIGVGPDVKRVCVGDIVRYQPEKSKRSVFTFERDYCLCLRDNVVFCVQGKRGNTLWVLKDYVLLEADGADAQSLGAIKFFERSKIVVSANVVMVGPDVKRVGDIVKGDVVCFRSSPYWKEYRQSGRWLFFTKVNNLLAVECG